MALLRPRFFIRQVTVEADLEVKEVQVGGRSGLFGNRNPPWKCGSSIISGMIRPAAMSVAKTDR